MCSSLHTSSDTETQLSAGAARTSCKVRLPKKVSCGRVTCRIYRLSVGIHPFTRRQCGEKTTASGDLCCKAGPTLIASALTHTLFVSFVERWTVSAASDYLLETKNGNIMLAPIRQTLQYVRAATSGPKCSGRSSTDGSWCRGCCWRCSGFRGSKSGNERKYAEERSCNIIAEIAQCTSRSQETFCLSHSELQHLPACFLSTLGAIAEAACAEHKHTEAELCA